MSYGQNAPSCDPLKNLPHIPMTPHKAQMTRLMPTLSVLASTPFGEMKIPDPIIQPTIMAVPLNKPS